MKRDAESLPESPEPEAPRESGVYTKGSAPGFQSPSGPRRETLFSIRVQERPSVAELLAATIPKAPRLPTRVGPALATSARARRQSWARAALHSALIFAGVTMMVLAAAVLLS
jgi:hypothetical protein